MEYILRKEKRVYTSKRIRLNDVLTRNPEKCDGMTSTTMYVCMCVYTPYTDLSLRHGTPGWFYDEVMRV